MSKPSLKRSGTLIIIAVFLAGSAVLRIGGEASKAIAKEIEPKPLPEAVAKADPTEPEPFDAATVLSTLRTRSDQLDARARALEDRAQALDLSERQIDQKLAALIEAEERLRETIALAEVASEEDLVRLTSVYAAMKPKDAAPLFEEMAPEFAAGFLGRMQPEAAAQIMGSMQAGRAYAISVILAGRNASVPTE